MRVAEDQMHSAISQTTKGFGVYDMDATLDWCGGFWYWCWNQACAIKGFENPFGASNTVLWSPQRAIHWAMQDADASTAVPLQGRRVPWTEKAGRNTATSDGMATS